jgi:hypothetical protein
MHYLPNYAKLTQLCKINPIMHDLPDYAKLTKLGIFNLIVQK